VTVKYKESDTPEGGAVYLTTLTTGYLVNKMAPVTASLV
jgi:hypothetical protein